MSVSICPSIAAFAPPAIWRLVAARPSVIVALNAEGRGPPVYCIHSIAGDIAGYDEIAHLLGPEQPFYAIQVPKPKMTAAFATNVEAMATHYVEAIVARQPAGPLVIAGFSAGAIVALEVAQQLRALGRDVPLLVALDGAPNNSGAEWTRRDPRYIWNLIRNVPHWLATEEWRDWAPRGLLQRIVNRFVFAPGKALRAPNPEHTMHLDAVSNLLDRPEWQASQRAFIRAMFNAMCAYVPKPYTGRVIVYETQAQPLFHLLQIGTVWSKLARRLEIVRVPGKHPGFFHGTRTISPLAAHLREALRGLRDADDNERINADQDVA